MFSCSVGVFKNGRVEIIANDQGNRITPSYVAFTSEGERLIGDAAKNQLTSNPENTVFDAKRLIGRTWGDSSVQQDVKYFPFKVGFDSLWFDTKVMVMGSEGQQVKFERHTWYINVDTCSSLGYWEEEQASYPGWHWWWPDEDICPRGDLCHGAD